MATLKSITIDGQKFETTPEFNRKFVKEDSVFYIAPDTYTGNLPVDYRVKNYTPTNGVTLAFNLKLIPRERFEDDGINVSISLDTGQGEMEAEILSGCFDVNYSVEFGGTHGSPYAVSVGDAGFQEGYSTATITNPNNWVIQIITTYKNALFIAE